MNLAITELIIGVLALSWTTTLVWALYVILTTPQGTWKASHMSQLLWLVAVLAMPLLGTVLFAVAGRRRLAMAATLSNPETQGSAQ